MTSLIVAITVVGIATIWPSKVGVLYAALLWAAIFAMNRLDYFYVTNRVHHTENAVK